MYTLLHDITIGSFKLKYLLECEIRKSANKLSDTATIKVPGMAYGAALEIESKVKRGDAVSISLGYDEAKKEFEGFVSSVQTDNTIIIECEDNMFKMRKDVANKQYASITAGDLIKEVASQIGSFDYVVGEGMGDVRFDKFTVNNSTAWEVLEKIVKDTGIHIFFKGNTLHAHLKYTYKEGDVVYDFARNVEQNNLKYISSNDKKVLVEVIGITRSNQQVKVNVGEKGGDKITVHRYNVTDPAALQRVGEEELKKYAFTGYEGDITGWLLPYVSYGYSAKLNDPDYPAREGTYYVEAVTTKFSQAGGSRKATLGIQL